MRHYISVGARGLFLLSLICTGLIAVGQVRAAEPATQPDSTGVVTEPAEATQVPRGDAERARFCAICDAKKRFHEVIPWLELGADLRHRMIYDNALKLDKNADGHERFWLRERARVWARVKPVDDLEFNIRAVFEPRYYCKPESMEHPFIRHEALFDLLNVKVSNVGGLPLSVVLGRQELKFGDGWLVLEGTPLDGTRTLHFDAARATFNADDIKTIFDAVFILNHANSSAWIRPFNDRDVDLIEHDEIGGILYASNKSLKNHTLDGYFIYKHDDRVASSGSNSDIYTFGGRIEGHPDDHLSYRGELAQQFGHKNGESICALGANTQMAWALNDPLQNSFRAGYEFRSGDDKACGAFDPLWGRYPQWSNIFNGYTDTLEGLTAMSTNIHRLSVGWTFNPAKKLSIATDYHLLFANKNTMSGSAGFSNDGKFRGQLLTCLAKYTFNEHVSTHLVGEVFVPGNYYDDSRNDVAFFGRWELMLQW